MKIETKIPKISYPYLAVFVGAGGSIEKSELYNIKTEDIVLISKIEHDRLKPKIYVQYVNGKSEAYITEHEEEYQPLPKGFELKFIQ